MCGGIFGGNPNGLHRPFSLSLSIRRSHIDRVSNPNGLHRPFSRFERVTCAESDILFQTRTGSTAHLAHKAAKHVRTYVSFQTRTGSTGHLACYPPSIAWEATLCKCLRGSRFLGVFLRAKGALQQAIFASGLIWSDARVYAQRIDHCDPRLMVALTRCRHGVHLVVAHPPFPPYLHNCRIGNRSARYLLCPPCASLTWSIRG